MKLSKKIMVAAAVGALGVASAVPAMALENEFHGMYRAYGFMTNALSGSSAATAFNLQANSKTDKFIEQRARLQYIAKASDDLKLITHFELDTKFGGAQTSGKYTLGDSGNLDADRITLETKSVYLDFKIPSTPVRASVGIQPFNDSFGGLYGNFDATGAVFAAKTGALTATYGYFTVANTLATTPTFDSNKDTADLNVLDLKFAINKDLTVGASYYMLLDKLAVPGAPTVVNNTVGLNAAAKFGPASLTGALGFQFGKANPGTSASYGNPALSAVGTTAIAAAVNAKVSVGPGAVNVAALYLSGDNDGPGYNKGWQSIGSGVNYYTPANMWLIARNVATINSSVAIGGNPDLTRNGRGILGVFAGYEGTAGKVFYNGNVGYAKVANKQNADSASIGTELNATIGYKLYSNLSAQFTAAYAILGDGYGKENVVLLNGATVTEKYDNPFLTAIALNYAF